MSLKRGATTELNHENWEKEDEPEEKGSFLQASEEELQNRVIKKARRKFASQENKGEGGENKPIFSGFKGFGSSTIASATTVSSTSSPFSFLSKLTSSSAQSTSLTSLSETKTKTEDSDKTKNFKFDDSSVYYSKLKGLNQAVSSWIKKHVDENPLCILTPIFNDYENYLKDIQENLKNGDKSSKQNKNELNVKKTDSFKSPETNSSFSKTFFSAIKSQDNKNETLSSSFDSNKLNTPGSSTFSFGQRFDSKPLSSNFSFGTSNKPFTFNGVQQKSQPDNNEENEAGGEIDDEDEPPKVDFTPVEEKGSIYSKRCKVFIKNNEKYSDLGVGTLHLKPVENKDKTQLLVRADTNIGKILLNVILSEGIPTKKMGKNNVMMVCIPTPEAEQKPVAVLLRVKTTEESDELLETINKYKK